MQGRLTSSFPTRGSQAGCAHLQIVGLGVGRGWDPQDRPLAAGRR